MFKCDHFNAQADIKKSGLGSCIRDRERVRERTKNVRVREEQHKKLNGTEQQTTTTEKNMVETNDKSFYMGQTRTHTFFSRIKSNTKERFAHMIIESIV